PSTSTSAARAGCTTTTSVPLAAPFAMKTRPPRNAPNTSTATPTPIAVFLTRLLRPLPVGIAGSGPTTWSVEGIITGWPPDGVSPATTVDTASDGDGTTDGDDGIADGAGAAAAAACAARRRCTSAGVSCSMVDALEAALGEGSGRCPVPPSRI